MIERPEEARAWAGLGQHAGGVGGVANVSDHHQRERVAGMLGTGVVLTWQGEGHTAYPQTRCVVQAVNRYLLDGVPPAAGTTCTAR